MVPARPRPIPPSASASSELDERILRSLRQIIRSVDLYSKKLARRFTLTGPQLLCLRQIATSEPVSTGTVAKGVSLSPATVTGILDRLEARGAITRERSRSDRRQVLVSLTGEGKRLVAAAPPPLHERFAERLHSLPIARQQEIADNLASIVAMMEAEDLDAAPILAPGAELREPTGSERG